MKVVTIKCITFSLLTLSLTPLCTYAGESRTFSREEGILHSIRHTPGENTQIKLDDNWYPIENNTTLYMCGTKNDEKGIADLAEYTDYRISLSPSGTGTFNEIHIMCE